MAQLIGLTALFQICENIGHIFAGLKKRCGNKEQAIGDSSS
jgi:hypothetical protein